MAWEDVTTPKKSGGLGLSKIQHVNDALLLKWSWRYRNEGSSLWKKVVLGCHGSSNTWSLFPCSPSINSCWKFIVKNGEKNLWNGKPLNSFFVGTVGDGKNFHFWVDAWLYDEPLRILYPHLYRIEKNKWALICDRIKVTEGRKTMVWDWSVAPNSPQQITELFNLLAVIYDFEWKGGDDKWEWSTAPDGLFSVKKAKNQMLNDSIDPNRWYMSWSGWAPLKCKIMAWRAIRNRLPTKKELVKRGVPIQNITCTFCNEVEETALHIFTGCFFTAEIWTRVQAWCKLAPMIVFEVSDLLKLTELQKSSNQDAYVLTGIIITTMWAIWNERNNRNFHRKYRRPIEVVENIKTTSFFWIRNRAKKKVVDWNIWCVSPLNVL